MKSPNKIIWTDEFSVGSELIDEQHKKLISILNNLIDLSESENFSINNELVLEQYSSLIKYAKEHFRDEELILLKTGCPYYSDHRNQHFEFIEKIAAISQSSLSENNTQAPSKMLDLASSWLKKHILIDDMNCKSYLSKDA